MVAALAGDQKAYRTLLQGVERVVRAYLRTRVRRPVIVDEITQDVLLKVHVARHTYDPKLAFEPWLFALAHNTWVDQVRRFARKESAETSDDALLSDAGRGGDAEAVLLLQEAVKALTPDQREAFELIQIEGRTVEEASAVTGASPSAVKVRAHRAYKIVRGVLGSKS